MFVKDRFPKIREQIAKLVGKENIFEDNLSLAMYCYDSGLGRARPEAVVCFDKAEQVAPVVRLLHESRIPFVARGAATNLSGGCVPLKGGVILNLSRLDRILEIDTRNEYALVEPGVVNAQLQEKLADCGYFYAPDPASQKVCTLGGNAGENAGGPRCLKYGVTGNHVLAVDVVLPDGEIVRWSRDDAGPDLAGFFVGSEGTIGIATRLRLRILKLRPCVKTALVSFPGIDSAIDSVSKMIAAGITPCALEAMDKMTIAAVEAHTKAGYPLSAEAVVVLEFDGDEKSVEREASEARRICESNGASGWVFARDAAHRQKLWEGRKGAYAAMARLAPNVLVEDGVVPRPKLPQALREMRAIAAKYDVRLGLLFHAGDGNLHPHIIFDERNRFETNKVKKAGYEMLKACVALGGSISGEHGVGLDKRVAMSWLFDKPTLEIFRRLKNAFDAERLANPDKIIPIASHKGEQDTAARPQPPEPSAEARAVMAEVLARAAKKTPSLILGQFTRADRGFVSRRPEEPLRVNKMCSVIELDKDNYTVSVEAGIALDALRRKLSSAGMHLPLPSSGGGTLGGLLATKACPDIRDCVLGMRVLLPSGELLEFGGKTVKNAAGYDAAKLFLGSWGAYGIIMSVTLRCRPSPCAESAQAAPRPFVPNEQHRKVKLVFDSENLFNPWIFAEAQSG